MKFDEATPKVVLASDYQAPGFLIDKVELIVDLDPERTRIDSKMTIRRNPERQVQEKDLYLDGEKLELIGIEIDGKPLSEGAYEVRKKGLLLKDVPDSFSLEISIYNNPKANTALEGLYLSHGMFCTQCEAEGFRRITYYMDRPDVLSRFTTTIKGDKALTPLMLSNGNKISEGEDGDRHWVTWEDPFLKPSYLFALVAGDLSFIEDEFQTMSGRQVTLRIFAEDKDVEKLDYAMQSIKDAMAWDEKTYGREYDLDLFMVVAVSHFNMGAMENKGLNIFNTSCVLAHPKTTTDAGFLRVQSVVAHEYFHNWSGNRVTLRDWFQLSLKEGLTVYREHEFAADMNNRMVKRISDVNFLRNEQFPEDQGPMAHPVRPARYQKIDNFYTRTVYEKGAEVVRMQAELLGKERYRKATDDYFSRFDGKAVTCDDFVATMERAGDLDLGDFKRWYSQSGTPLLEAKFSQKGGVLTLKLRQESIGKPEHLPHVIPVKYALLGEEGPLPLDDSGKTEDVLLFSEKEKTYEFQVKEKAVPSLLRGFSAPVSMKVDYSLDELVLLLTKDNDGVVRWDAAQRIYLSAFQNILTKKSSLEVEVEALLPIFRGLFSDSELEPAALESLLALPSETVIGDAQEHWTPKEVHQLLLAFKRMLGERLEEDWWRLVADNECSGPYRPIVEDMGKRALKWRAYAYLARLRKPKVEKALYRVFEDANNMTDELSALTLMVHEAHPKAKEALERFEERHEDEALVMDKFFALQATSPGTEALETVKRLLQDEKYLRTVPNRVRSLWTSFTLHNPSAFHDESGEGYLLFVEELALIDKLNPQLSSRLVQAASRLGRLMPKLQEKLRSALEGLLEKGCSENLSEVLGLILKGKA